MLLRTVASIYCNHKKRVVSNSRYPKDFFLFVTSACNSKCPHCFYWEKKLKDELSKVQILKLIDSLPNETETICLTGGEPTLRHDIAAIAAHALKKAETVTICTNGILIDRIKELSGKFFSARQRLNFQISIDGDESTHDLIRGKGAYKAAMDTIDFLSRDKWSVVAVMTVSKLNFAQIENVFNFLYGLVTEIRINIVRSAASSVWHLPSDKLNIHHNPREDGIALPFQDLEAIRDRLFEITNQYPLWRLHNQLLLNKTLEIISDDKKERGFCLAGIKEAVIYQTGEVSFCEFFRPFGNIAKFHFDFKKLWDSQLKKSNMKFIKNCCCLHSCNLSSSINYSEQYIIQSIQTIGLWNSAYCAVKRALKKLANPTAKGGIV